MFCGSVVCMTKSEQGDRHKSLGRSGRPREPCLGRPWLQGLGKFGSREMLSIPQCLFSKKDKNKCAVSPDNGRKRTKNNKRIQTMNLDDVYDDAIRTVDKVRNERRRDHLARIGPAIQKFHDHIISDVARRILEESRRGKHRLRLYGGASHTKFEQFPVVFLLMGPKDEGTEFFKTNGIETIQDKLENHFRNTRFKWEIKKRANNVMVDVYWGDTSEDRQRPPRPCSV